MSSRIIIYSDFQNTLIDKLLGSLKGAELIETATEYLLSPSWLKVSRSLFNSMADPGRHGDSSVMLSVVNRDIRSDIGKVERMSALALVFEDDWFTILRTSDPYIDYMENDKGERKFHISRLPGVINLIRLNTLHANAHALLKINCSVDHLQGPGISPIVWTHGVRTDAARD